MPPWYPPWRGLAARHSDRRTGGRNQTTAKGAAAGVSICMGFGYTGAMEGTGAGSDRAAPGSGTTRSALIVATEEIAGDAAQAVVDEIHCATGGSPRRYISSARPPFLRSETSARRRG